MEVIITKAKVQLPPNRVIVRNGRVVTLVEWILWRQMAFPAIMIQCKDGDMFHANVGPKQFWFMDGSLADILQKFPPDTGKKIQKLFKLRNADEAKIHALKGFDNYQVVVRPAHQEPATDDERKST